MKNTFRLLALLLALQLGFAAVASAGAKDRRLDVYWIDVEGGAATLIVTPAGESILIDTGNPGPRDTGRIVKMAIKAGVRQIDHLIVTHYHRDHYGGATQLSTQIPIHHVHDNGIFKDMPDNPGKAYFNFKSKKRTVINPGDLLGLKQADGSPSIQFRCLGTRRQFIEPKLVGATKASPKIAALHKPKDRDGSDNANSVVMKLSFGPFRFYDGGDLTWNQEKKLVIPFNLVGEVDVYQVTHHGLSSSNNPALLQTLQPSVVIMNNGVTKGCAPSVFADINAVKSLQTMFQVHRNLRPDGAVNNVADEFIANAEKDCKANYIKLSVAPDGKSYTVSIPATGKTETYKTK